VKIIVTYLTFLSFVLLAACGGEIHPGNTEGEKPAIQGLALYQVAPSLAPVGGAFVGTVESADRAQLVSRTDGRVTRIAVKEGSRVARGDLLVVIGENAAERRLNEAEGARKVATARLELAEKTFSRYQGLFEKEAITPQEMDQVVAERDMAKESLASAVAAVGAAQVAYDSTRIVAPYDGRVIRHQVEVGSTVLPGTPLMTLDREGGWRVRAEIPETFSGKVSPGMEVKVDIPALHERLDGKVSEILPATDPMSRSFQAKVAISASADLTSGLFARVFPPEEERTAILVPRSSIIWRGQLTGVFVVKDKILHYRMVKTGLSEGDRVEILSGISPGETIVSGGAERAKNGARVEG